MRSLTFLLLTAVFGLLSALPAPAQTSRLRQAHSSAKTHMSRRARTVHVKGYTRHTNSGKAVHVHSYNRRSARHH